MPFSHFPSPPGPSQSVNMAVAADRRDKNSIRNRSRSSVADLLGADVASRTVEEIGNLGPPTAVVPMAAATPP